jgi:hypothetical protein
MKLRVFVYRLAAVVTAFILGVGFFNAARYAQAFFRASEIDAVEATVKRETLFFPPRVEPSQLIEARLSAPPEPVADDKEETQPEFSPDGDYYILGDVPKGFKDVEYLNVTTTSERAAPENNYEIVSVPPEGYLWNEKKFDFDSINVSGKRISFETEAKKGVSYKFVGEFIDEEKIPRKSDNGEEYFEYAVLKGRLIKMRDGKKIAESKVKLGIVEGC